MDNTTILNVDDRIVNKKIAILGDVAVGKSSIAQR
jgi:GTPase SAR1 family protein